MPSEANDGIAPVYPKVAADPRAVAVCEAVHALPAQRKAECCAAPSTATSSAALVQTCVDTLSGALSTKNITLDNADACIAARREQLKDCAWVAPLLPPLPKECGDILKGSSGQLARCRSSLECADGMRCIGGGPLEAGRCGKASGVGGRCGYSVDALAVVVGQPAIDAAHPDCASGVCVLGRCQPPKKSGDECRSDLECGPGNRCDETAHCAIGRIPLGGACKRGGCTDDAFCMDGKCTKLRAEGESCSRDFDCLRGGCVDGKCAMSCSPVSIISPKK